MQRPEPPRHAQRAPPRYVAETGRHSPEWQPLYDGRTAAERTHGDLTQQTPKTIVKPRLRNIRKLAANACIAHHYLLWHPLFTFVTDVTHLNDLAGHYQSTSDETVLIYRVATLHQLAANLVRGLLPSNFT